MELMGALAHYTRERKEGREEKEGDWRQWKIVVLPCHSSFTHVLSVYSAFHEDFPLSCEIGYRMQKSLI